MTLTTIDDTLQVLAFSEDGDEDKDDTPKEEFKEESDGLEGLEDDEEKEEAEEEPDNDDDDDDEEE